MSKGSIQWHSQQAGKGFFKANKQKALLCYSRDYLSPSSPGNYKILIENTKISKEGSAPKSLSPLKSKSQQARKQNKRQLKQKQSIQQKQVQILRAKVRQLSTQLIEIKWKLIESQQMNKRMSRQVQQSRPQLKQNRENKTEKKVRESRGVSVQQQTVKKNIESTTSTNQSFQQKYYEERRMRNSLQQSLSKQQRENGQLQSQLSALKEQIAKHQSSRNKLVEELAEVKYREKQLLGKIDSLAIAIRARDSQIAMLRSESQKAAEEVKRVDKRYQKSMTQYLDLQRIQKSYGNAIQALTPSPKNRSSLNRQRAQLLDELSGLERREQSPAIKRKRLQVQNKLDKIERTLS